MNAIKKAVKDFAKEVDNDEFVVAQEKLLERINENTIPKDVLREKIDKIYERYCNDFNATDFDTPFRDKMFVEELKKELLGSDDVKSTESEPLCKNCMHHKDLHGECCLGDFDVGLGEWKYNCNCQKFVAQSKSVTEGKR